MLTIAFMLLIITGVVIKVVWTCVDLEGGGGGPDHPPPPPVICQRWGLVWSDRQYYTYRVNCWKILITSKFITSPWSSYIRSLAFMKVNVHAFVYNYRNLLLLRQKFSGWTPARKFLDPAPDGNNVTSSLNVHLCTPPDCMNTLSSSTSIWIYISNIEKDEIWLKRYDNNPNINRSFRERQMMTILKTFDCTTCATRTALIGRLTEVTTTTQLQWLNKFIVLTFSLSALHLLLKTGTHHQPSAFVINMAKIIYTTRRY